MYFIIRNNAEPKKNILLGATLPQSAHGDHDVQSIVKSFRKWLNLVMLPMLALLVPPFFLSTAGAATTWFMTWMLLIIVLPFVIFGIHREKLMRLKRENNWRGEAAGRALADIKAAAIPARKIKGVWFLLAVVMSLIPVVYALLTSSDWENLLVYATFAVMTAIFWPSYHLIFRLRSELINEDLTLTLALTRIRRNNWGKFWLVATWATGALNLLIWPFDDSSIAFLIVILLYTLLLICVSMYAEFSTRIAQQKLTAGDTGELYLDEDDYWFLGMFYYNPNDNHFFVNDRVGMNLSCNLAKFSAKLIMGFAVLCIIAMPFLGIWLWKEEVTPTRLVLSDTVLTARHTGDAYVILLGDIESVELVDEMPYILSKNNGFGFPNLNKGRFTALSYGSVFLCVQVKDPPFLIVAAGGNTYIFNDADPGVTRDVFWRLSG